MTLSSVEDQTGAKKYTLNPEILTNAHIYLRIDRVNGDEFRCDGAITYTPQPKIELADADETGVNESDENQPTMTLKYTVEIDPENMDISLSLLDQTQITPHQQELLLAHILEVLQDSQLELDVVAAERAQKQLEKARRSQVVKGTAARKIAPPQREEQEEGEDASPSTTNVERSSFSFFQSEVREDDKDEHRYFDRTPFYSIVCSSEIELELEKELVRKKGQRREALSALQDFLANYEANPSMALNILKLREVSKSTGLPVYRISWRYHKQQFRFLGVMMDGKAIIFESEDRKNVYNGDFMVATRQAALKAAGE